MRLSKSFLALLAMSLAFSCEKDDPVIPNEQEVITTFKYTLTPEGGGTSVLLSFKDLDGEGGNKPEVKAGTLASNKKYKGTITLFNEQASPVEDITAEIREEKEDHQFFWQTTVVGLSIAYADKDDNGKPIGLNSVLTTTKPGKGTLTLTLRHKPNKSARGASDGDSTNAGGETDIEVTFQVNVK